MNRAPPAITVSSGSSDSVRSMRAFHRIRVSNTIAEPTTMARPRAIRSVVVIPTRNRVRIRGRLAPGQVSNPVAGQVGSDLDHGAHTEAAAALGPQRAVLQQPCRPGDVEMDPGHVVDE